MPGARHREVVRRHCAVRGCESKHGFKIIDGTKVYSPFCPEHTCGARYPFVPVFCTHARSLNAEYCDGHQRIACRNPGCQVLVQNPADVPAPWFCPAHTCEQPHCFKVKVVGRRLCAPHLGMLQMQQQARRAPRPLPRCQVDDCHNPRIAQGNWCEDHTCRVRHCHNETYDDDEQRCVEHMPCDEAGCDRYCVRSRDGRDAKDYCERHITCAIRRCDNDRGDGGSYCERHTCMIRNCHRSNDRDSGRQFCDSHTCTVADCAGVVADSEDEDSHICFEHKCADAHCLRRAGAAGGCCERHACLMPDCFHRREHTFCREHECTAERCHFSAVMPNSYCLEGNHACTRPGCRERRTNERELPTLCAAHRNQTLRQDGADEVAEELERLRRERARERDARLREEERRRRAEEREQQEHDEHERNERIRRQMEADARRIDREMRDAEEARRRRNRPRFGFAN